CRSWNTLQRYALGWIGTTSRCARCSRRSFPARRIEGRRTGVEEPAQVLCNRCNAFAGLDCRRGGNASDQAFPELHRIAKVRVGVEQGGAFHGAILAVFVSAR